MLGLERQGVREIRVEVGGALARDAVDEIERDVVETGITKSVHRAPDVIRCRPPLEDGEQVRPERLGAERDARHSSGTQEAGELGRDRLRVGLDRQLGRPGQRRENLPERVRGGEGRRAAADEDGLERLRKPMPFELQLGEQRVGIGVVLADAPDRRDEVAVATAMHTERQVDIQVLPGRSAGIAPADQGRFLSPSRLRTARNASCGTSTPPTCFIRFLPFFCFSSSLRLREMSPP